MSRFKQKMRKWHHDLEADRLAALRCPGCAKRNVLAFNKKGIAECTKCGHRVSSDLYRNRP